MLGGCASTPAGIEAALPASEAWGSLPYGRVYRTGRARVHTTLPVDARLAGLLALIDAAPDAYGGIGRAGLTEQPLEWYVLARREQWVEYTRARLGGAAPAHLRVRGGGYTWRDIVVIHDIGEDAMPRLIAHEGWHQYCARAHRRRLPPAIEEGLAACFEQVERREGGWEWRFPENAERQRQLAEARSRRQLRPLRQVLSMDAGEASGAGRVDAYYAQCWALARWLATERPGALAALLRDAREGEGPADAVAWFESRVGAVDEVDAALRRRTRDPATSPRGE